MGWQSSSSEVTKELFIKREFARILSTLLVDPSLHPDLILLFWSRLDMLLYGGWPGFRGV